MKRAFLFLSIGCMEMTWLYAWANFLTLSILHQSFPFLEAISTFGLAVIVTLFAKGKGWRVIYVLGIQVFGFIFSALRIVYVIYSLSTPFLSHTWVIEFFNDPRSPLEWIILILVLFLAFLLWIIGLTLANRSMTYSNICVRFDLGVVAFFLLFFTKLALLEKGGIKIYDPISLFLLFPFFIFSLLTIGLVRNQSSSQKDFSSGYQAIGVILSFAVAIFIFGTGLTLFFWPYLSLAAESGYGILKIAAKPIAYIFVEVIRFLYMPNAIRPEKPSAPLEGRLRDLKAPTEGGWLPEIVEKILIWGLWGLLGLMVLIISGLVMFYLLQWLLSRTPILQKKEGSWYLILRWVERFREFLLFYWKKIVRSVKGYRGAVQIYMAFLNWGRRSGLPHLLSETPLEYGLRLQHRFPPLKKEIELIIETFNQEVYGEMILNEGQLAKVQFAWHRLRSPIHWPSRLKSWFHKSSEGNSN